METNKDNTFADKCSFYAGVCSLIESSKSDNPIIVDLIQFSIARMIGRAIGLALTQKHKVR